MPQPNIQNMLKQAQEAMAAQQEAQEALTIDPDAVDPEDVEMLQDLVLAATNEALRQAVELQEKAMAGASGAAGFDPMEALQGLGLGDALGGLGGGGGLPGAGAGGAGLNRAARRAAAKKNR
jgi:hypothetical protein